MGDHFATFMRITAKDVYWLDTRMTAGSTCRYGSATPAICKLAAQ
ncbi:hypothetical protein ACWCQP_37380 [Streptomyces chartreusis]